jgi:hypothetical protein
VRRDAGGRAGIHYYSMKLEVLDPIEAKGYCLVLRKRTRCLPVGVLGFIGFKV